MAASTAQRAVTAERRAQALKLRTAGADLETIKARLGYSSVAAVSKDLTRALQAAQKDAITGAKDLLALNVGRVERLMAGHWLAATGGNVKSAQIVLSCLDRLAKWQRWDEVKADSDSAKSVLGALARGLKLAADILPEADDDEAGNNHGDDAWEWQDDDEDDTP